MGRHLLSIHLQFGLKEQEVIDLMRTETRNHLVLECDTVQGRKTKHEKLRNFTEGTFKCTNTEKIITTKYPNAKERVEH
jgi:uncharacterized protein (TIGR03643 family)